VLETVGLTLNAGRRVDRFSGGMRRRLNLAVAVLHEPKLLLLDEPTVGVDAQSRSLIFEGLRALNRTGTTVLFATHYMEEAERLCARLFIVDHGKVLVSGETRALVSEGGSQRVFLEIQGSSSDAMIRALRRRGHNAVVVSGDRLELRADPLVDLLGDVAAAAGDAGVVIRGIESHRPTLEDRFLELTGRHLRD
jgi:ABC-2 type transport system ATP-binding protein